MVRIAIFAGIFCVAIFAASIKRIVHSIQYSSYYETSDAGKVGSTEFILHAVGFLANLIFGTTRSIADWWKRLFGFKIARVASDLRGSTSSVAA